MKISFLLLFVCVFQMLATNGNAQNAVVNLSSNQLTVAQLIEEIEKQTDYLVVYSNSEMNTSKNLTLKNKSAKVSDILQEVFGNEEMKYEFENNYIILSKRAITLNNQQDPGKRITGTVVDDKGEPVIGASISEKGTRNGIATNLEGKFSLQVSPDAILVITYIGYTAQEITIGNQTNLNITLIENSLALDEVVVIGYGSMKKGNLTSAISHVSSKDFLNTNSINPLMQIQGKVAGVSITNTAPADPNSTASIQIRGVTSRSAGLGPLIVVDGVPGADLHNINNNDIESIDILKDGAASAIYGTRGSNGVVIVTTKKGSAEGTFKAEYNGFLSMDVMNDRPEILSADEFRQYRVSANRGIDVGYETDWLDAVSQTAVTQTHAVSFSGGNAYNNYRISADYRDAKGIDLRSAREEIGARLALTHKAKNGLYEVYFNLAPRILNYDAADWSVFSQALFLNPTLPIKDPADPSGIKYNKPIGFSTYNIREALDNELDGTEGKILSWSGTFKLNLLPVIAHTPKHTLNTSVSIHQQITDNFNYFFRPSTSTRLQDTGFKGEASRSYAKSKMEGVEWLGNYKFQSNDHTAAFVGGYSYQYFQSSGLSAENKNFTSDALTYNNLGNGTYMSEAVGRTGFGTSMSDSKLIAFFGRATYDYMQKYLLTASLRYEGSSKFGANHKWGAFPAASVGWRISQEGFLESASWLNDLKLRADLGITGNQDFGSYQALATYRGFGYVLYNGTYYQGWMPSGNVNLDLKWEKGINWNIGLDFSLFDYRLTGSINYYNRTQQDLLGTYTVPSPPYLTNSIFTNVGTMKNTGLEMELNIQAVKTADFEYNIGLVGATNNNKFVHFSNDKYFGQEYYWAAHVNESGINGDLQQLREGQRVGTFVTWAYAGLDETGNWLVYDKDNNAIPIKQAVDEDKRVTGNGLPKFTASFNNTFRYKNWDASIYLRGVFGFDAYNVQDLIYGLPTTTNDYNTFKKAYTDNANITGIPAITDYFLEKGDYVKLDVLSIGYNFKFNSKWAESLRLYCTGRNLATFTAFSGVNPQSIPVNGLYPGINNKNYYPSTRQFLFGVQLTF